MGELIPYIGQTVHYVAYGTPGGEFPAGVCRAATITEIEKPTIDNPDANGLRVGLCVMNPTGLFFNRLVPFDGIGHAPGTWHVCEAGTWHVCEARS